MYKQEYKSNKEMLKLEQSIAENRIKCSCGHTLVMPKADRTICSYCKRWVYRNKEIEEKYKKKEFEIKMKRMMKNGI